MGTKGRQIVGMDINELLEMLNKAFADEWLAYYQYWLGAKIVKGPMKDAVASELLIHATEELNHANLLAMRIIQLGGTPLISPDKWLDNSHCGYDAPTNAFVKEILTQNIKGEQCAIDVYQKLLKIVRDVDPVTYNMVLTILQDEVEHEEDLQSLDEDLESLMMRQG
jgi:bacterioferritin